MADGPPGAEERELTAIILCGGAGTRIRSRFPDLPKALIPVAGRPFIEIQLEWLAAGGIRRVVLAAGYGADRLEAWRTAYLARAPAVDASLAVEPRPLGTGGATRFAAGCTGDGPVLILNGDSLAPNLDFQALEDRRRSFPKGWKSRGLRLPSLGKEVPMTTGGVALAAIRVESAGRFGTVEFDDAGRVTAFREKAKRDAGWVNGGVYALDTGLLRALPADIPFSLETDLFPALAKAGALLAVPCDPPLLDIGTPDGLAAAERALAGSSGR